MEVGAKDIFIMNTLATILLIVAISIDNFAQRFFIVREESPSLVIFKAVVGFIEFFVMNLDVTDIAIIGLIEGIVTHDAQTFNSTARSLDIVLA